MSQYPLPREPLEHFDKMHHGINVVVMWDGATISKYTGVIVERFDKKKSGRIKRRYLAEFNEKERAKIATLHTRARKWVLRSGHPDHVRMSCKTFDLLRRAANFFATA